MKLYLMSLGAGILVGIVYSLLNVRSPAPPVIALVGLFGMLVGEQVVPVARQVMHGGSIFSACSERRTTHHIFGLLPSRQDPLARSSDKREKTERGERT